MQFAALVLAAGQGARLAAGRPKAFVELAGRPLLAHTLEALAACPALERLVPVLPEAELDSFGAARASLPAALRERVAEPVAGGARRQDSAWAGLEALGEEAGWIAVHDAARPFVRPDDVDRVLEAARTHGAAILAVPVRDTLKRVRAGAVVETPPREECWAAQTPQVFRADLLREALAKARAEGFEGTDDAQLVERLGVPVRVVAGHQDNVKITTPEDLVAAQAWLAARSGAGRP